MPKTTKAELYRVSFKLLMSNMRVIESACSTVVSTVNVELEKQTLILIDLLSKMDFEGNDEKHLSVHLDAARKLTSKLQTNSQNLTLQSKIND